MAAQRRRMYLLERAYRDCGNLLTELALRCRWACGASWQWLCWGWRGGVLYLLGMLAAEGLSPLIRSVGAGRQEGGAPAIRAGETGNASGGTTSWLFSA